MPAKILTIVQQYWCKPLSREHTVTLHHLNIRKCQNASIKSSVCLVYSLLPSMAFLSSSASQNFISAAAWNITFAPAWAQQFSYFHNTVELRRAEQLEAGKPTSGRFSVRSDSFTSRKCKVYRNYPVSGSFKRVVFPPAYRSSTIGWFVSAPKP
jgi:hypothetical protein